MSDGPLILGVGASPRQASNSHRLMRAVLAGAGAEGAVSEAVLLREKNILACVGCERCRKEKACKRFLDDMQALYPLIEKARGLVLASPVHNYNVTAWMKAFIDRLYCYYDFTDHRPRGWSSRLAGAGRRAVVLAVGEQPDPADLGFTLGAMSRPLTALGYEMVGELGVTGHFDAGAVAGDQDALARAEALGRELARSLV